MKWRIARNVPKPVISAHKNVARWPAWPEQASTFRKNHHEIESQSIQTCNCGLVVLSVALLQPLAFAQMQIKPGSEAMHAGKNGASSRQGAVMDMKGMMKDNNDKMSSMKMTGNTDVDFAMMMRIHHVGAIDMAQAELRDGKDPQMKKMAKAIIAAQKKEIAQFDKFLAKNGQSAEKVTQ
ncbi:DUF305 domain-containing protein [Polaromonas sp.]|uniref:DUF305 domain-containing protein n=1 Tax=Polaromonas sp. TaxID=1869339 RepID=UPI002488C573|nr:DUF305 domain-containing protein [Polaromonas sp.]MDI1340184.1 DUF305 domain-containing protein [Polaromonas sp.]